jgi:hypothetical protein
MSKDSEQKTEKKKELGAVADKDDPKGAKLMASLQSQDPDVLFIITRSKNLVCFIRHSLRLF